MGVAQEINGLAADAWSTSGSIRPSLRTHPLKACNKRNTVPVYDAAFVQVEDCWEELADEWTRGTLAKTAVLLAFDVRQQLAAASVLRHQTVQRRRLRQQHHQLIHIR